ncbi:hypothetical protein A3H10_02190 [Candidatus Uhrbacteria bacterium RIFCSPLOWO2_12_FULL_46_10]|uniref:Tagatose-bisphosphate aldolase n=1 Tax=Candidatus Uhrbacteria bacterium RIFCSPLOWO2_01_FULL_47_25 TaxID=1802402 RepID=A0A1F7UW94_9BACT|nr:MAG: Tagatose-bisphosphate aldolase [Parcubacteria group bacterium GW2011_GWA2_46_9]OGL59677.1 MAG: hypothetical protein A2752_05040 [Candidatus Uhrbacteria bacterium RIFCSPHIGHO2_01_FULL_46_23]OGL68032.1 MAG: hypothetical protein A3D60_02760 [Candidatus Uhrbacteria bacterium RIFCSPHIGHO2_02_FULL_47_29]OGL76209.1 MAG: hypothetical protein A3E96_03805 [Candidatus Uhrbacteria bacterium RIFCSPHIGHO2_12_FULL_46_13]OGL82526.1 MAG: hypothetical protein A2936_03850 [Candidatus Uhrbacteria bacterium
MPHTSKLNLKEILSSARRQGWAVPHFNISDIAMLRGLVEAANELRAPILVGTSEGESDFLGRRQAVALVSAFREEHNLPIFINADHCHSVSTAKAAVDAGYDSVHIDLSKLPLDDNIAGTKKIVAYARAKNTDISVEGEVGYLVTDSSQVYKRAIAVPVESLAKVEDAKRFIKETGVDRLAPAVGTLHGIAANAPRIDIERVQAISKALGNTILVLHGGSGAPDEQIRKAIAAGIANIHFSTDIRLAYVAALREFIMEHPEETTPYKILAPAVEAVRLKAMEKIKLMGAAGRLS